MEYVKERLTFPPNFWVVYLVLIRLEPATKVARDKLIIPSDPGPLLSKVMRAVDLVSDILKMVNKDNDLGLLGGSERLNTLIGAFSNSEFQLRETYPEFATFCRKHIERGDTVQESRQIRRLFSWNFSFWKLVCNDYNGPTGSNSSVKKIRDAWPFIPGESDMLELLRNDWSQLPPSAEGGATQSLMGSHSRLLQQELLPALGPDRGELGQVLYQPICTQTQGARMLHGQLSFPRTHATPGSTMPVHHLPPDPQQFSPVFHQPQTVRQFEVPTSNSYGQQIVMPQPQPQPQRYAHNQGLLAQPQQQVQLNQQQRIGWMYPSSDSSQQHLIPPVQHMEAGPPRHQQPQQQHHQAPQQQFGVPPSDSYGQQKHQQSPSAPPQHMMEQGLFAQPQQQLQQYPQGQVLLARPQQQAQLNQQLQQQQQQQHFASMPPSSNSSPPSVTLQKQHSIPPVQHMGAGPPEHPQPQQQHHQAPQQHFGVPPSDSYGQQKHQQSPSVPPQHMMEPGHQLHRETMNQAEQNLIRHGWIQQPCMSVRQGQRVAVGVLDEKSGKGTVDQSPSETTSPVTIAEDESNGQTEIAKQSAAEHLPAIAPANHLADGAAQLNGWEAMNGPRVPEGDQGCHPPVGRRPLSAAILRAAKKPRESELEESGVSEHYDLLSDVYPAIQAPTSFPPRAEEEPLDPPELPKAGTCPAAEWCYYGSKNSKIVVADFEKMPHGTTLRQETEQFVRELMQRHDVSLLFKNACNLTSQDVYDELSGFAVSPGDCHNQCRVFRWKGEDDGNVNKAEDNNADSSDKGNAGHGSGPPSEGDGNVTKASGTWVESEASVHARWRGFEKFSADIAKTGTGAIEYRKFENIDWVPLDCPTERLYMVDVDIRKSDKLYAKFKEGLKLNGFLPGKDWCFTRFVRARCALHCPL